jgi:hypothetical protein
MFCGGSLRLGLGDEVPSRRVTTFAPVDQPALSVQGTNAGYRDGVWSTMSLVWQGPITPHFCLSSRKQQPERTRASAAVAAQLTLLLWGQAPTGDASTQ